MEFCIILNGIRLIYWYWRLIKGTDLIVGCITRSQERSTAARTARRFFIPFGHSGFVDEQSGQCHLKRILLPVDNDPDPSPAVEVTADLIRALSSGPCEVRLLHVGDSSAQPALRLPAEDKAKWRWVNRLGSPVTAIREEAEQEAVDLIVMTTSGRHGFFDALRGSTTEQIVEHARCPVLAVHAWSD